MGMAKDQDRSKVKPSGGRIKSYRKKKLALIAREPSLTKVGERRLRRIGVLGGNLKLRLLKADTVNVLDQKTKTHSKAKIITIAECPANRNYVRRNIMTKGTIVETDKGKARITSRPGQDGSVNAVLI